MRILVILPVAVLAFLGTAQAAPIHDAAKKGDAAAIAAALDAGVDVNAKDEAGWTPLYSAVRRGHLAAAKLLLERGADASTTSSSGSALLAAVTTRKVDMNMVRLLLEKGADPDSVYNGDTVLQTAARRGCFDCLKALVETGGNVNAQNSLGETVLHLARRMGTPAMADYLLANGVVLPRPAPISDKLAAADAKKGEILFNSKCANCHSIKAAQGRKFGPNLWDVVGRDKASVKDAAYSDAMRAWDGVWTYEDLNIFLSAPMATTPGVSMDFPGIPDEAARADLIAYLHLQSDKPMPLP
jgi:cytochrome c